MFVKKMMRAGFVLACLLLLSVAAFSGAAAAGEKTATGNLTGADTYLPHDVADGGPQCEDVTATFERLRREVEFQALPFHVTAVETLEVETVYVEEGVYDTVLSLYCDSFDPAQPGTNLMAFDDDGGSEPMSAFTASDGIVLYPGRTYWLVVALYSSASLYEGSYQIDLLSETAVFDELVPPLPPASCDLESGFNIIHGTEGNDKLEGTPENDIILGYGGDDRIEGMGGNDCLIGGDGHDQLFGNEGNDILWGGESGSEVIPLVSHYAATQLRDRDKLYGGDGDDEMYGGADKDRLDGGDGNDLGYGGDGDDKLYGGDGNDVLHGENGRDALKGDGGDDTLTGGAERDNIQGNDGDDELYGDDDDDKLYGGKGDDFIDGGAGDRDALQGSQGTDTCVNGENLKGCELDGESS